MKLTGLKKAVSEHKRRNTSTRTVHLFLDTRTGEVKACEVAPTTTCHADNVNIFDLDEKMNFGADFFHRIEMNMKNIQQFVDARF